MEVNSTVNVKSWKRRSRVRGLPSFGGELPVSSLAEEITTPGDGQVRGLLTIAGNPVSSTPSGHRLDEALAGLDVMVSIDFYVNETTRHADVILPPTGPLERDHYDLIFHTLAVRDTAKYSPPVFARPAQARHEWEILNALTARLTPGVRSALRGAVLARGGPKLLLDLGLRTGPYGRGFKPFAPGLSLSRLRRSPHGEDLGALKPALPARLRTRDRRIAAAPASFVADVARLEAVWLAPSSAGPMDSLALIGRRGIRSCNSWMHNAERLVRGKNRCTLQMHPCDAEARGLPNGALVRIASRVGTVEGELEVTDVVMPGVVSLPHGWGHGRAGTRMAVAAAHPGVSINDLTDDQRVDALTGNAAFSGVRVTVSSAAAE